MDLVKIRKNSNKTKYSIDNDIDKYVDISYEDILNIFDMIVTKEAYKERFKIDIETKSGEYSFNNFDDLNENKYLNFVEEGIERIRVNISSYFSDDLTDYLDFTLYLRKDFLTSINIQTLDELFARGLYSKIYAYITNIETWYSGVFNAVKRFELISFFIVIFIGNLVSSLHAMGIRYRYIIFLLGINLFVLLISIVEKSNFINKTNFVCQKKKSNIFAYFRNPLFWQHVINTIVTIVLTTLANVYILKH